MKTYQTYLEQLQETCQAEVLAEMGAVLAYQRVTEGDIPTRRAALAAAGVAVESGVGTAAEFNKTVSTAQNERTRARAEREISQRAGDTEAVSKAQAQITALDHVISEARSAGLVAQNRLNAARHDLRRLGEELAELETLAKPETPSLRLVLAAVKKTK